MKTFLVLAISVLLVAIVVSYVLMSKDSLDNLSEKKFQALLKKKAEEIKITKEALQPSAQRNLNFLRVLAKTPEIVALAKTGVLLSVHPESEIFLRWSSAQQRVQIIALGWDDDDDLGVENLKLDEIQNLAELSERIIIQTIVRQLK